ncbi:MAG TPA: galactose oxidase-like domain-containing protein [Longimicrobium sp.]|nr:galactose oxidase-like domain-containing protein [Longimicrobium sp.]
MPMRSGSILIQSTNGTNGNFEVVIPRVGGGIAHLWRNNDSAAFPWTAPAIAFGSTGDITAVTCIQSNFGPVGNLEVVAREGNTLVHNWRDDGVSWKWSEAMPIPGATAVSGAPGFCQSTYGTKGNFEVVAPLAGGGLGHWFRENDVGPTWSGPFAFGSGTVGAAALIQSNYGTPGNLEVIARVGGQLVHYFRDATGWKGPFPLPAGTAGAVAGVPAFIQSRFGTKGNFEVVAPLAGGGLAHWWRGNDAAGAGWNGPFPFGSGPADAVGLVHGSFGNLEVVARSGALLVHYFRDAAGWHGPYPVAKETPCPATGGQAAIAPFGSGAVAIHMALMRTGKLLVFGYDGIDQLDIEPQSRVVDPVTGAVVKPPATPHLFCSGHAFLPGGQLLVAGGHHHDVREVHTFDPATQAWTHRATMEHGRWYPTCTVLPDGRVFILSGRFEEVRPDPPLNLNNTWQIFDGTAADAAQWKLGPENLLPAFSGQPIDLYPFVYALPSGKLLVHSRATTRFFTPPATGMTGGTWDAAELRTRSPLSRTGGDGASVLLPLLPANSYRARVMVMGGRDPEGPAPGLATAEILDLGAAAPAWQSLPSMSTPRLWPNAVLLPDGKVLVTGGSAVGNDTPVFAVESFDPATLAWKTLCSTRVPRLYHSTAVLLPDGRVLMAGKDGSRQPLAYRYPEYRCEVFSPPYLFTGTPRPTFSGAPAAAGYGAAVTVQTPNPAAIGSVVLIRPGAVTHCFDMEQRMVGLTFTRGTGAVTFQTPPNRNVAPRGWYMLFLVSTAGVPSVATFLRLG